MKTWISETRAVLIAITGTLGIAWFATEPAAEKYIRTLVKDEGFASSVELTASNVAVEKNAEGIRNIKERSIRMETKQETIESDVKEVKKDLKDLLRELRQQNRQ